MSRYDYLIVGGGLAADAAVRGIRELDAKGTIGLISSETDVPYARPLLSKGLWKGEPLESVFRGTGLRRVELHLGVTATTLDAPRKRVQASDGATYTFAKLLLATGGVPRRLPFGGNDIIYYRTLDDYRRLRRAASPGARIAVIGGGFIGSEVAAALTATGCQVTMFFPEEGIGARLFPSDLAKDLVSYYRDKDVEVRVRENVTGIHRKNGKLTLATQGGHAYVADAVVAGIGITPSTTLAESAGLQVEDGIVVDQQLRTSDPAIFAAGDVARFEAPALGNRIRVEHEDNSVTMGRAAGRAMAGDTTPYTHLPFFYSDLFELGYEAVGEMDPRAEIVADWKEAYRAGVVYYMKQGRVRGVLLWNTFGKVDAARALIAEPGPFTAAELKGRLGK
jgi:3-phenylpropionate/trans-cinnamate dioxygenase ferredoxin reductase subunit